MRARVAAALRNEQTRFRLGLLLCGAIATWLVFPVTNAGMIVNLDAPRHLLRVKVVAEQFLPSGHIDGWSPYWYLGAQLFLFQSYGYFFVSGLAAYLLANLLDLGTVFKVFYCLPILTLPLAMGYLARRLGVSRDGTIVAALASLVLGTMLGFGMRGLFVTGLLIQAVGVVLFAVAWPSLLDALDGRPRQLWIAALLLGATLVTHFITGAYSLATVGIVAAGLAVLRRDPRVLYRYAAVAALVLLLAGHALFPTLQWHELGGGAVGWGKSSKRAIAFVTGWLFGTPLWTLPAYAAAIWAIFVERSRLAVTALVLFGTAAVAVSRPLPLEPDFLSDVLRSLIRPRALPYSCLFVALFMGVAYDRFAELWKPLARRNRRLAMAAAAAIAITLGLNAAFELVDHRANVETEYAAKRRPKKEFSRVVKWLRRHSEPGTIVAMERTAFKWARLGARSSVSVLNYYTGVYVTGGDQVELTSAARRGRVHQMMRKPEKAARRLRKYGVTYAIVTDGETRKLLAHAKDFEAAFEDRRTTIYRVRGGGVRLSGKGFEVKRFRHISPEQLRWTLETGSRRAWYPVTAAVSYHPNWQARVDGRTVPIQRVKQSLMRFRVPAGAVRVELEFQRSNAETFYNWLSGLTLLAVVAGLIAPRRRAERIDEDLATAAAMRGQAP